MIPERHVPSFREIAEFPPGEAKRMLDFIAEVAAAEGLTDYRVVVNVGEGAGQTIFHLHWHILGGGREEQALGEEQELAVLEEFMPAPLSEDELEEIIDDAIAEVGATSIRDLGRVMADVMPQIAGRADGSVVSQLVREKLA